MYRRLSTFQNLKSLPKDFRQRDSSYKRGLYVQNVALKGTAFHMLFASYKKIGLPANTNQ